MSLIAIFYYAWIYGKYCCSSVPDTVTMDNIDADGAA